MKRLWVGFLIAFGVMASPPVVDEHLEAELRAKREGWVYNRHHPHYATGLRRSDHKAFSFEALQELDVDVPDELDLREQSTQIRSQASCGSCWSFSIMAMLRDALKIKGLADPGALSEQYLVDCATDMYGCNGGMPEAAKWVTVPYGAPSLSDYPYTARNGRCQKGLQVKGQALEWHYVGQQGRTPTTEEIMKAIVLYGPVSVTVAADNAFAGYSGGVFHGNSRQINHMTDINGWSKKGGYWIMRNSWGQGWGMQGWGFIAFGANSIGEETIFVKVKEAPPAPVLREFSIESQNVVLKVTLKPENKLKVEDARAILAPFLK